MKKSIAVDAENGSKRLIAFWSEQSTEKQVISLCRLIGTSIWLIALGLATIATGVLAHRAVLGETYELWSICGASYVIHSHSDQMKYLLLV